jgi:hypothetical protein
MAILALTLFGMVSAAAAEARKARPASHAKKATAGAVAKPVKLTPARRAAMPRSRAVASKAATTGKLKNAARSKAKALAVPRAERKAAIKRVGKARPARAFVPRRLVAPPAPVSEPASASLIALTLDQKATIYSAIVEMPLRPRPVPTERLSRPPSNAPPAEPATVGAAQPPPVVETVPTVGEPLPATVAHHPRPPRAAAVAPEIEAYRYAFVGERVLLIDPATGIVVAAIEP